MLIDAHQHVFWQGRDDRGLIADMDGHGIDLAWLLTSLIAPQDDEPAGHGGFNPLHLVADGTHPGIVLSDILLARDHYPARFIAGYCPHPLLGDAPRLFEAVHKMHGVRVCGEWKFRVLFDDPRCLELFHVAGRLGCPVVLHLDVPYSFNQEQKWVYRGNWIGGTIDNLRRALEACPETTFIGHAPGFWRHLGGDADKSPGAYPTGPVVPGGRLYGLFDGHPNLMADLSAGSGLRALERDPAHAAAFLTRYADRLLFGRDNYGRDLHDFLSTLTLPPDVRDKIYSRNALKLVPV